MIDLLSSFSSSCPLFWSLSLVATSLRCVLMAAFKLELLLLNTDDDWLACNCSWGCWLASNEWLFDTDDESRSETRDIFIESCDNTVCCAACCCCCCRLAYTGDVLIIALVSVCTFVSFRDNFLNWSSVWSCFFWAL